MQESSLNIPKGWTMTTLGEVAEINKYVITQDFSFEEIEYIDIASVENRQVSKTQILKLKDSPSRAKRIIKDNDILISTVRPNLKHYCIIKKSKPNLIASTGFAVINAKNAVPYYLYYLLTTNEYTDYLAKIADSQTSAYPAFNPEIILNSKFPLPSLPEQRAIAGVLSSLDDKIELLRTQNQTLEQTAQAIFKEWFVNFNFPGAEGKMIESELGEIPQGWEVTTLDEICSTLASGGTPSTSKDEYWNGDINWFSTKELQDNYLFESEKKTTKFGLSNSSAKIFPQGSIVMAIYAAPTVGRLGILGIDSTFNQAACGFVADEEIACNEYIYLFLLESRDKLNNLANGAAQQNLNVGLVRSFKLIMPEKSIMEMFRKTAKAMFNKIFKNSFQIKILSSLRDILLPKLMKGEIRVNMGND